MAASVSARYNLDLRVTETLGLGLDLAADGLGVVQTIAGFSGTLHGASTVPATMVFSDTRTLAAGTDTLDLTALTKSSILTAITMTGLRVRLLMISTAAANTSPIVVAKGASNGYFVWGATSDQVTIGGAGTLPSAILLYAGQGCPAVSSSAKNITITSSDTDAIYSVIIVAG